MQHDAPIGCRPAAVSHRSSHPRDYEGEQLVLHSLVFNEFFTYGIFNLQWVYWTDCNPNKNQGTSAFDFNPKLIPAIHPIA